MKMKSRLFVLPTLLLFGGCYTFQSATIESLPAGSTVLARLTPTGAQEVGALTGEATDRIEGGLVRMNPDTLVLAVWRTDLRSDLAFIPGRMQLPLPTHDIVDVFERRLSYARTGALSAVLAFGLYQVFLVLADDAGGTSTGGPDPGGPVIIRCC